MKISFVCFLKIMSMGHVLDPVLDHMILGFVTMALHKATILVIIAHILIILHLCIDLTYKTKKFYTFYENCCLFDHHLIKKRLFTKHLFFSS